MALQDSDLFAVYRESDTTAYHLKASNLQFKLPYGDDENYMLIWNGDNWVAGTLDGGLYEGSDIDTVDGGSYAPEVIVGGASYDSGSYDPIVSGTGNDLDGSVYV